MKISSAYFSHRGKKTENEDAVLPLMEHDKTWWTAIADGMGGHVGGKVASTTAVAAVKGSIETHSSPLIPDLFNYVKNELRKVSGEHPDLSRMGTTLSLLAIHENIANVGHVGDSRVYHLRNEGIISRTVDQTEVQELIERGVLSKASARRYSRRNVLLSVLSPDRDYRLQEVSFEVKKGDRLVLMTDGVSSKVLAKELRDLSLECDNPKKLCDELLKKIELRHPVDDYTAICLDIVDP